MAYPKVYRINIDNYEGQRLTCDILDYPTQTDTIDGQQIILLDGAENPFVLSVVDNEEDKFTPIRAHQLQINFLSTPQVNLNTFAEGPDNRWYVELYFAPYEFIFKGFVILNDVQEDFICDPNVVTLTATDGLGGLKDIPLTDYNGVTPKGKYSLVQYLSWCLFKCTHTADLNIANSLFPLGGAVVDDIDLGWWYTYVDAKTFEDEIGTCEDCYRVIEKILGQDCFLTMYRGQWWVIRVEEMDGRGLKVHRFNYLAQYIETIERQPYEREIFSDGDAYFINEATYVTYERPYKLVKETYNYEYPKEAIDNIDFSRGDLIVPINLGPNASAYDIDDWQIKKNYPAVSADTTAYIKRIFEDGYEKERYVVIAKGGSNAFYYIESNPVPVSAKDKFSFSVDVRFKDNWGGSGNYAHFAAQLRLTGEDGSHWSLDDDGKWYLSDANWATNNYYIDAIGRLEEDQRDWVTASVSAQPVPVSGELVIWLIHAVSANVHEKHFSNLSFDYKPFINGSYAKYDGHYHQVQQSGGYNAKREEEVYLNDAPRKLFKGALWVKSILTIDPPGQIPPFTSTTYNLTKKWKDWSNTALDTTGFNEYKPYGWWQAFSVWNQHRRTMRLFDAQVQGCYEGDLFGLIHLFLLKDTSPHTNKKKFMLLHYEVDLRLCEWKGFMAEMIDTDKPKTYSETENQFEFKFIESR